MILTGHCFTGRVARGPACSNKQQFLICLHLPQPWSSAPSPEMCLLIFHTVNYVSKFLHRIQKSDLIWDIPFTLREWNYNSSFMPFCLACQIILKLSFSLQNKISSWNCLFLLFKTILILDSFISSSFISSKHYTFKKLKVRLFFLTGIIFF